MGSSPEIDRSKWHKPTYLGHYDERATHYEGIACRCKRCGVSFVFSAESQKHAFEFQHQYPGWLPSLCTTCCEEWQFLKKETLKFQHQWDSNRTELASNKDFLNYWLASLKIVQEYGKNDYTSIISMLIKATENT
jgi:hypothetical protein